MPLVLAKNSKIQNEQLQNFTSSLPPDSICRQMMEQQYDLCYCVPTIRMQSIRHFLN